MNNHVRHMMSRLLSYASALALLASCGDAPLQQAGAECDPQLGADACTEPLVCETEGEASTCELPRSQQLSEPCDPSYGIDACGATLVCAALDGRTRATCYPERSRLDRSECSTDNLCMSGSCNMDAHRCKSAYGMECDPAIGCAKDPAGFELICSAPAGIASPLCHRPPLGKGSPCTYDVECGGYCQSFDATCS